jgi:rhamnosyltransferase
LIDSQKKVLVLLATFNGEKYVEKQMETILSQKQVDVHILISDDLSTDNTMDIIRKFSDSHKNITILESKNKFGSAAANFFHLVNNSNLINYDYAAFSDQDDIWFEDKLFDGITKLEQLNADGFSSDVIAFWPQKGKKNLLKKSFPQKKYDYFFEGPGPGCSQIFTSSSFSKFRDFIIEKKKYLHKIDYHDWLIYSFYRNNNYKWVISNTPKMLYVQHENNQIGANSGLFAKIYRIKKIQNNWYSNQVLNNFSLIVNKDFRALVTKEKLIFKPFSLRRKISHSVFIWLLLVLRIFNR